MKKRFLGFLLAFVMLISCAAFSGCSHDNTPPAMTYKTEAVSEAMLRYWISSYKAYFLNILGGTDTEEFLNSAFHIEDADGTVRAGTVGDYISARITEIVKSNLISLSLFREYGLSLSKSVKADVETRVQSEIENAGGRKALNEALARIGINMDILREVWLAEEKVNMLYNYLYGETMQTSAGTVALSQGAEPITAEQYQAFYEAHYACAKHIYIRTTDKNVLNEDGTAVLDENGNVVTEVLSEAEAAEKRALCRRILEELNAGADFDEMIDKYSEDSGRTTFTKGYIVSASTPLPAEFIEAAFDMKIGEIRLVETDYATHIMLRTELPEAAWLDSIYGTTLLDGFTEYVKSDVYAQKIAPMITEIEEDAEILSSVTVYSVPASSY